MLYTIEIQVNRALRGYLTSPRHLTTSITTLKAYKRIPFPQVDIYTCGRYSDKPSNKIIMLNECGKNELNEIRGL